MTLNRLLVALCKDSAKIHTDRLEIRDSPTTLLHGPFALAATGSACPTLPLFYERADVDRGLLHEVEYTTIRTFTGTVIQVQVIS